MNTRALASQNKIIAALFLKLATEPFSDLTIAEISAAAGVSRKTFYRHFSNKTAVLNCYLKQTVFAYFQQVKKDHCVTYKEVLISFFTFWNNEYDRMQLLKRNQLLMYTLNLQREYIVSALPKGDLAWHQDFSTELVIDLFSIGGLWNVYFYHLDKEIPLEPQFLATEIVNKLKTFTQYLE
ncbi:TetR/AcrR family transcriptional regulator [Lactiplantibacillus daowaiensis]|uniref:TetR/AcrR family transcriptional regulator n=1 Tax=Lactiplantibacillus daowaiensis TaxID=2559918 RepID=A0ABW1S1A2_9LACO|nr:TetR/AcrR family transcriptional regulator [Lactiplantibacillus daowaiensis]